jgi:hypothetical protein
MDRSLVQATQHRSGNAPQSRVVLPRVVCGGVRSWREGRTSPHAGYVGRPLRLAGMLACEVGGIADPVAGPIELAHLRVSTTPVSTLRSRPQGSLTRWPFDAPRDLPHNSKRSALR